MKLAPKQLFFTIVLVLSGAIVTLVINSTSPIAAVSNSAFLRSDVKPAAAAYGRRDFETVRKLAEQGDDQAQYYLGRMYEEGTTVPESWEEKLKWYRLAADNGIAPSTLSACCTIRVPGREITWRHTSGSTWRQRKVISLRRCIGIRWPNVPCRTLNYSRRRNLQLSGGVPTKCVLARRNNSQRRVGSQTEGAEIVRATSRPKFPT